MKSLINHIQEALITEAKVEISVSVKYAKEANDAIEDSKHLFKSIKQTSSNSWKIDKNDIDDIEDLFKSWKIPSDEITISESLK
jgi:hypothetical protein